MFGKPLKMSLDSLLLVKIAGASIGSSIAVVFRPAHDSVFRLVQRFVIGTIFGVIFAPILMNYMEWPREIEYWLSASATCGLLAYLILQLLFSTSTRDAAQSFIDKKTGK
jgi:integral membrane sensor domain MASE1